MPDYRRTMTMIVVVDHIAGDHDPDDWDEGVATAVEEALLGLPAVWRGETEYQIVHASVETVEPNDDAEPSDGF